MGYENMPPPANYPQQPGYPPQQQAYPPQGYPPQQAAYPPQQYPAPGQQPGYPPPAGAPAPYPPQQPGYPPAGVPPAAGASPYPPQQQPGYPPVPTAPPVPQAQPQLHPSVAKAYAMAADAIAAESHGDVNKAVSQFSSAIGQLKECDKQGLFPSSDIEGVHFRIAQYETKVSELEKLQGKDKKKGKKNKDRGSARGTGFGWAWTWDDFEEERRRQLDSALEERERAEVCMERGKLREAKGRLMACAEELLDWAKDEEDPEMKHEVRKEAREIIDEAEMVQDMVCVSSECFVPCITFLLKKCRTHTHTHTHTHTQIDEEDDSSSSSSDDDCRHHRRHGRY